MRRRSRSQSGSRSSMRSRSGSRTRRQRPSRSQSPKRSYRQSLSPSSRLELQKRPSAVPLDGIVAVTFKIEEYYKEEKPWQESSP
ncbi:hypothetical protein T11_3560 [Trichinella zimbabwensis]|uniref:Uncharacterized protein n=1 Tax=Trichinella zimbabwensis TaxID=268475 RepID=A0A0V1GC33_9BILA|nr:hypothetical protein T11_3560 [Trichinella zimbabwensis]